MDTTEESILTLEENPTTEKQREEKWVACNKTNPSIVDQVQKCCNALTHTGNSNAKKVRNKKLLEEQWLGFPQLNVTHERTDSGS